MTKKGRIASNHTSFSSGYPYFCYTLDIIGRCQPQIISSNTAPKILTAKSNQTSGMFFFLWKNPFKPALLGVFRGLSSSLVKLDPRDFSMDGAALSSSPQ